MTSLHEPGAARVQRGVTQAWLNGTGLHIPASMPTVSPDRTESESLELRPRVASLHAGGGA